MALQLGKDATIEIGVSALGKLLSHDIEVTDGVIRTTTYDSTAEENVPLGLPGGKFSVEAIFDAADVGQAALETALGAAAVTVSVYPSGASTTGEVEFTGSIVVDNYRVSGGLEDVHKVSISGTGYLAQGTVT